MDAATADYAFADTNVDSRPPLRIVTCGSVDDGKSTLIGRLLRERNLILEDQHAALARDSQKHGTTGGDIDYALLLDGLEAEREQGITIDVAYRYFATSRRAFIVADAPGHEQYTRNMVTAASNAEVAVLLVDARKGLTPQTRRHAIIAGLLGVCTIALAINKMDLVDYDRGVFERIVKEFSTFARDLGFQSMQAFPLSALHGDNIALKSARMTWYGGPPLLEYLETAAVDDNRATKPFRMAVQWVNRPHADFRCLTGTLACGRVRTGDMIMVLPSVQNATIKSIFVGDAEVAEAMAGDAVTITLAENVDATRGDMLSASHDRPQLADQFAAHLVWMSDTPLYPGRSYLMKINNVTLGATVSELKYRVDIGTLAKLAAKTLAINETGFCNVSVSRPVPFDSYSDCRDTGAFILIDRGSNETVAAGMIAYALRRAGNIHFHRQTVGKSARSALMQHRPAVLWFTGLPAAGKSTIANLVEAGLHARGVHTVLLDGDNVRHGLNKDLGFTEADRVENIRRIGEAAKLMTEAGLVVLCCFISPFRAERRMLRELLDDNEFVEVFVDTPLAECIRRDPKGLYRRALSGEIRNFTGIDQAYEPPESPDIHLDSVSEQAATLSEKVIADMERRGIFDIKAQ